MRCRISSSTGSAPCPAPARDLAHLLAVVPTRADPPLISDAPEQVDLCIAAGVLVPNGDGVSFRHELFRSAVEDSLSPMRRAELHRQVLRVLAKVPDADPGRLVHHALLADDHEAVLRYGQIAGAAAARQGAHREAARHYQAAAAYSSSLPEPERADLLERYAAEAHSGRRERAGARGPAGSARASGKAGSSGSDRREPPLDISAGLVDGSGDADAGDSRPRPRGA